MGFYCPVGMCGQLTTTESTVKGLKRCLRDGIALSHEKEGNVAATELQPYSHSASIPTTIAKFTATFGGVTLGKRGREQGSSRVCLWSLDVTVT